MWLFAGSRGTSSVSGSLASLGQAPGVAPPAYVFLDTASVALYLGQLEGGIAKSEQLTQQLTQGRNAGVSAGGLSLGGSTGSSSSAERVVTPTASARFYQLLDLLSRDGYLHTIDMAGTTQEIRKSFAAVPEGSFVKLESCTIALPSYVQLAQRTQASKEFSINQYQAAGQPPLEVLESIFAAQSMAGQIKGPTTGYSAASYTLRAQRRIARAVRALAKAAGPNPRVPLSTCDGRSDRKPRGVDLLFPVHLESLSSEQSLLAGPVTLVGKLVRAVRKPSQAYADEASLETFLDPVDAVDLAVPRLKYEPPSDLDGELKADAVVVSPGAVILPIAIYK